MERMSVDVVSPHAPTPRRRGAALGAGAPRDRGRARRPVGPRPPPLVAWEVARDHERCFGRRLPPARLWSSDPAEVREWLESRGTPTPFLPPAPTTPTSWACGTARSPTASPSTSTTGARGRGRCRSSSCPAPSGSGTAGRAGPRPPRAAAARGRTDRRHRRRERGGRRRRGPIVHVHPRASGMARGAADRGVDWPHEARRHRRLQRGGSRPLLPGLLPGALQLVARTTTRASPSTRSPSPAGCRRSTPATTRVSPG